MNPNDTETEHDVIIRRQSSCWCGLDHPSDRKFTDPRMADKPASRQIGQPSDRVFIGNLPFSMSDDTAKLAMFHMLRDVAQHLSEKFRLIRDVDGKSKGVGFIKCSSNIEAANVISCLDGHELFDAKNRRLAIRAEYAKPQLERHVPSKPRQ